MDRIDSGECWVKKVKKRGCVEGAGEEDTRRPIRNRQEPCYLQSDQSPHGKIYLWLVDGEVGRVGTMQSLAVKQCNVFLTGHRLSSSPSSRNEWSSAQCRS